MRQSALVRPLHLLAALVAMGIAGCGVRTPLNGAPGTSVSDAGPDRVDGAASCTTSSQCDDGLICNGPEACVGNQCRTGTPLRCDDGIACTIDACTESAGCVSRPDATRCNDGEQCIPSVGCTGSCTSFESNCFDGADDDCDGAVDCADVDCVEVGVCGCLPSERSCFDGRDDDCDGTIDCGDADCVSLGVCECTMQEWACLDGVDNDCDGLFDCSDPNCNAVCNCTGIVTEETGDFCQNNADDDCDGLVDCAEPSCMRSPVCAACSTPFESRCVDQTDDDCDGLLDCADPDCSFNFFCTPSCSPTAPFERQCLDGLDDDCNGLTDCFDPSCTRRPECSACTPFESFEQQCFDGLDGDCDGFPDCADPDCMRSPACGACEPISRTEVRCRDGFDDDCDGLLDCADPDCAGRPFCQDAGGPSVDAGGPSVDAGVDGGLVICLNAESSLALCRNNVDDDCDGLADCADPDCVGPTGECCNGIDDTGEGIIDELACPCRTDPQCGGAGLPQVCYEAVGRCAPSCRIFPSGCGLIGLGPCNVMTGECALPR